MAASNCPVCNAAVDSSDRRCRWCGIDFAVPESAVVPPPPPPGFRGTQQDQAAYQESSASIFTPVVTVNRSLHRCQACGRQVSIHASACPQCGHHVAPDKSALAAGCLGLLLGPVGLWYKGQWAAGFAWLAMTVLLSLGTAGLAAPFCWIGMAIHAAVADTR
jgi:hypothetical protein